jgi:hypothetical protein
MQVFYVPKKCCFIDGIVHFLSSVILRNPATSTIF